MSEKESEWNSATLSVQMDLNLVQVMQVAPERRVFYIDVGTMTPQNAQRHIEMIKDAIHQNGETVEDDIEVCADAIHAYCDDQCLSVDESPSDR